MLPEPIELDKRGLAIWRHKSVKHLFVKRTDRRCTRVTVISESQGRQSLDDLEPSTLNFQCWIPVTVDQFRKVKTSYTEIYG